jgi:pimeloyl-ACP methyl ester carboxylesterase
LDENTYGDTLREHDYVKLILKIAAAAVAIALISMMGFIADAHLRIADEETIPADEGAPGRFVTVDGHKMHVATIGDVTADASGAPVVLLHGYGIQGHAAWLPWASKLAATRSVILPDLLGFGHSERIATPGPYYTLKGQAVAVAAVLDALHVSQVDIIGNGLGGGVAAQFALDYPTRVRRIVFMDAAIYAQRALKETGVELIDRVLTWHYRAAGPNSRIAHACATQPNCRWMRLARVHGTTDALRAMTHTPDDGRAALMQNIPSIAAPTLVIWGGNDKDMPVADGDRLSRDLKTTLAVIAEARDMPYVTQPDKVAERVLEFLKPAAQ